MPKKKVKSTNQVNFATPPETQDVINYRKAAGNVDFSSPINAMYGQMENDVENEEFYDAEMPESARSKIKYARLFNLRQNKGAALGAAKGQEELAKTGNLLNVAQLTRPQMYNSGGTQMVNDPTGAAASVAGGAGTILA